MLVTVLPYTDARSFYLIIKLGGVTIDWLNDWQVVEQGETKLTALIKLVVSRISLRTIRASLGSFKWLKALSYTIMVIVT